ncbi:MAG: hypothetical protein ACRC62_29655 [Microcoleus sp.]
MSEPPATTEPPDPASTSRKLTDLATQIISPPPVRSVAGVRKQFDCKIQQPPDSIQRTPNYRRALQKVEPGKAVREIFYGG